VTGRIFIRGVNWLGDAVMTTPALMRLRQAYPAAQITLLTAEKLAEVWQGHPAVNEVLTFATGESVPAISRRLKAGNYTHALVLPNSPRSALEVFLARIPHRIGYAHAGRSLLFTQAVAIRPEAVKMNKRSAAEINRRLATPGAATRFPETAHQIHEYLHLVAALGASAEALAPVLVAAPLAETALPRLLPSDGHRAGYYIGLNPGAEYGPAKRWPIEYFAAAANEIYRRRNCEFLIFGGPGDIHLTEELRTLLPGPLARGHVTSLAGKTKLKDLMVALKMCRVLITNDTGPMHVAAALGTPVVVPFGSTSPDLTGPGWPGDARNRLLRTDAGCAPCFLRECPIDFRCLKGIRPETVAAAVMQLTESD
jgi:heptosyltransferase-2